MNRDCAVRFTKKEKNRALDMLRWYELLEKVHKRQSSVFAPPVITCEGYMEKLSTCQQSVPRALPANSQFFIPSQLAPHLFFFFHFVTARDPSCANFATFCVSVICSRF